MLLNVTLLALPYYIQSVWAFPQGPSGTSVLFLFIVTLRPVPLQDVFLLPTQYVGTLTYLTQTVIC
jgi:hypothetical protein